MDESLTQAWYRSVAAECQDQYSLGEPGYGKPTAFHWQKTDCFAASKLEGGCVGWATWYAEEAAYPEVAERYAYLCAWWNGAGLDLPIVVEGIDGFYYPWDGCHRIGISCLAGRPTFPAIVGTRRKQNENHSQTRNDARDQLLPSV